MALVKEKFLRLFLEEFRENIQTAENSIILLKNDSANVDALSSLLRTLHSMKGSSRMLQFNTIERLVHGAESVFKAVREGRFSIDSRLVRFFFIIADRLRSAAFSIETGSTDTIPDRELLFDMCEHLAANEAFDFSPFLSKEPDPNDENQLKIATETPEVLNNHTSRDSVSAPISSLIEEIEVIPSAPVSSGPDQSIRVDSESIDSSINLVNTLSIRQLRLKTAYEAMDKFEKQLAILAHDAEDVKTMRRGIQDIARSLRAYRNAYSEHLFEIDYGTQQLRDTVISMRMIPLSTLLDRFPRMVEETAMKLEKDITITMNGDAVKLDRTVMEKISDPLIHLVRNSVDHGIEGPGEREACGKPRRGQISIDCRTEGTRISVTVSDDGRGFRFEAIRERALQLWPDQETEINEMGNDELLRFIFKPGFSTKADVDELSGRGIGLDIVKTNIESVKGQVLVESNPGRGCSFTLLIPTSASTIDGMFIISSGKKFFIPASSIKRTLLIEKSECFKILQKEAFSLNGMNIPVSDFAVGMKLEPSERKGKKLSILLIRGPMEVNGILVDKILGYDSLVYQALPACLQAHVLVQGIVFDEKFQIIPIINMGILLERMRSVRMMETHKRSELSGARAKPMILVVDDSISTREIEISLLEMEGFDVVGARDGVDALEKLREGRFDAIITDLAMPRMDGQKLIENIRREPDLADIPVIVVSTNDDPEVRKNLEVLGVKHYFHKSTFDQDKLLIAIAELISSVEVPA
jgi:chemotaxis protein histidine kinase CheA/ActR/RegA family two-component response regulator